MPGNAKMRDRIDVEEVEKLAAIGLTKKEIQSCMCVSHTTWYLAEKEQPELVAALNRGRGKHAKAVMGKISELALKRENLEALKFLARVNLGRQQTSEIDEGEIIQAKTLPDSNPLDDAKLVLAHEMKALKGRIMGGKLLTPRETQRLQKCVELSLKIESEERRFEKVEDLSKLSPDELRALASDIMASTPEIKALVEKQTK